LIDVGGIVFVFACIFDGFCWFGWDSESAFVDLVDFLAVLYCCLWLLVDLYWRWLFFYVLFLDINRCWLICCVFYIFSMAFFAGPFVDFGMILNGYCLMLLMFLLCFTIVFVFGWFLLIASVFVFTFCFLRFFDVGLGFLGFQCFFYCFVLLIVVGFWVYVSWFWSFYCVLRNCDGSLLICVDFDNCFQRFVFFDFNRFRLIFDGFWMGVCWVWLFFFLHFIFRFEQMLVDFGLMMLVFPMVSHCLFIDVGLI